MAVIEEKEKVVRKEEKTILFRIARNPKEMRIFLQSGPIQEFFSARAVATDPTKNSRKWGNVDFFNIPEDAMPKVPDATFDAIGEPLLIGEGKGIVNLSFLRAVRLDEGVTFKIPGLCPKPDVTSFEAGFIDASLRFVEDWIADYSTTFEITTRRVVENGDVILRKSV